MKENKNLPIDTNQATDSGLSMADREMMAYNKFSQIMDLGNNVVGLADKAMDVWRESKRIEQNISMIEAVKEVELQKIVAKSESVEELLAINKSVNNMVDSITKLELLLQNKLQLFENCLGK